MTESSAEFPVDDLGSVFEVAKALNVPPKRVKGWIERRDSTRCPKPVRILKGTHLYSISEWRTWHRLWKLTRGG